MRLIRKHVADRAADFGAKPLFGYLRDSSVEPNRRLSFVPFMAHFVMSFADLYRFFLVERQPRDHYQDIVNAHLSEDVHHWKWFLADLGAIGVDPTLRFSAALRFVWGDATSKTRLLTYQICKMCAGISSLEKLVMVHCIEASGGVALRAVAVAGLDFEKQSGRKLTYFGAHHVETESEHTMENPSVIDSLEEVDVPAFERARCLSIVNEAFEHFGGFIDEMFEATTAGNPFGNPP